MGNARQDKPGFENLRKSQIFICDTPPLPAHQLLIAWSRAIPYIRSGAAFLALRREVEKTWGHSRTRG